MKSIVFDSGPIITLSLNHLLWLIPELKKEFKGNFLISKTIKKELVDHPIKKTKRFLLEGLNVLNLIVQGNINVAESEDLKEIFNEIDHFANKSFSRGNSYIRIIHDGEIEAIALAISYKAEALVIDERTTRILIEDPYSLKRRLEKKLHCNIKFEDYRLKEFQKMVSNIRIIRSAELVAVAYELGLFDKYYSKSIVEIEKDFNEKLIEGILWGVKLHGCAISEDEIENIKKRLINK